MLRAFLSQTNWLLLKSEVSFLARLLSYCFACASPAVCFSALAFGLKLGILILLLWSGLLFTAFFVLKLLLRRLNCAGGRRGRRRGKGELTWLMVPHKPFPSATSCPSLHLVSVTWLLLRYSMSSFSALLSSFSSGSSLIWLGCTPQDSSSLSKAAKSPTFALVSHSAWTHCGRRMGTALVGSSAGFRCDRT